MKKNLIVEIGNKAYEVICITELVLTEKKCEFCGNLKYQTSLVRIISAKTKDATLVKDLTSLREIVSQLVNKTGCRLPSCLARQGKKEKTLAKMQKLSILCQTVGIKPEALVLDFE